VWGWDYDFGADVTEGAMDPSLRWGDGYLNWGDGYLSWGDGYLNWGDVP